MRARNLKPGFFKNADLAELSFECRLLFQGLWCLADRKGRLHDRPKQIKGEVFPYDNVDISTMLEQLQHHTFILRYEKNQNKYIQISNFEKHQYPHIKEQESTIPAPCKYGEKTIRARLNPESPILNPESPIPNPPALPDFEKVWALYPRQKGRKAAERHFRASVKTEVDLRNILRALENYKQSKEVKEGYVQYGSTWFNNWPDWMGGEKNGTNVGTGFFDGADKKSGTAGHYRPNTGLRKADVTTRQILNRVGIVSLPVANRAEKQSEQNRDNKPDGGRIDNDGRNVSPLEEHDVKTGESV